MKNMKKIIIFCSAFLLIAIFLYMAVNLLRNECVPNQKIKDFVLDQGCTFKTGRGFYELTKAVTVQGNKEIVIIHKETGDIFTGPDVRKMLGLPPQSGVAGVKSADRMDVRFNPRGNELKDYIVFIQSTFHNRKLLGETQFLYEVEDWDRFE